MSTLCTGFERRGMRLRVNERFRGLNGDQHGLRSQELDKGPSERTSWPIAPAHRLSRNRRGVHDLLLAGFVSLPVSRGS
jgi:hypothetical protein